MCKNKRYSVFKSIQNTVLLFCTFVCIPFFSKASPEKDSLLALLESTTSMSQKAEVYYNLGLLTNYKDIEKTIDYLFRAKTIAENENDVILAQKVNAKLGEYFFKNGIYDLAFDFSMAALANSKEINDPKITARALYTLGMFRLVLEDYNEALNHFEEAMDIFQTVEKTEELPIPITTLASYNNNLGLIYKGLGDLNLAKKYINKGLKLIKGEKNAIEQSIQLYTNLGSLLLVENKMDSALFAYKFAKQIVGSNEELKLMSSMVNLGIGDVFSNTNQLDSAYFYYSMSLNDASKVGGVSHQKHATAKLSEYFTTINIPDSALYYKNISELFAQQLKKKESGELLTKAEVTRTFEIIQKELEAELFSKKRMNYMILTLFSFAVILSVPLIIKGRKKYIKVRKEKKRLEITVKQKEQENMGLKEDISLKERTLHVKHIKEIHYQKVLSDLSENIENKNESGTLINKELKEILLRVDQAEKSQLWQEFEIRYIEENKQFYDRLHLIAPNLTKNERRLCAFLRLDMSTKEIIAITGQTIRAVEVARARLRKKLGLNNQDVHLTTYLRQLT